MVLCAIPSATPELENSRKSPLQPARRAPLPVCNSAASFNTRYTCKWQLEGSRWINVRTCASMCACVRLNSTCVRAVPVPAGPPPNAYIARWTPDAHYVCAHVRAPRVRRPVTCTCQNQYLASLGYDNATARRASRCPACIYIHTYTCTGTRVHTSQCDLADLTEFPCRPCWHNVRRKQCRAPPKLFPSRNGGARRGGRVTRRVYWTFFESSETLYRRRRGVISLPRGEQGNDSEAIRGWFPTFVTSTPLAFSVTAADRPISSQWGGVKYVLRARLILILANSSHN